MLAIRLQPVGRKGQRTFRVVVSDSRAKLTGRPRDYLGHYNSFTKDFVVDEEMTRDWIGKGAQPSRTVHNLLVSAGILDAAKIPVAIPQKTEQQINEETKQPAEEATEEEKEAGEAQPESEVDDEDKEGDAEEPDEEQAGETNSNQESSESTGEEGQSEAEEGDAPSDEAGIDDQQEETEGQSDDEKQSVEEVPEKEEEPELKKAEDDNK